MKDESHGKATCPNLTVTKLGANYSDQLDEETMQTLVTAVRSWRSRHVKPVERDELLNFIEQHGFAPDAAKGDIREVFDSRLRQLEDRRTLVTIIHALRPLARLSLSSPVVRAVERIAIADRDLHPSELEALNVIRRLLADSANRRPTEPGRISDTQGRGTDGRSET